MIDPATERREGALTANRIRELAERPLQGRFDAGHLRAIHTYIFQDFPHHRPGEMRGDVPGWSKFRALEGQASVHEVHYAHDDIATRVGRVLQDLGGPSALSGLDPDAFASRMAHLYGDLDHIHSFHEGNSRTLREFTRSLARAAGYDLNWATTSVGATERNRLYVARDIAVLERAFPGLTPQRGMETNDRAEYEASLALPALRRVPSASLEAIIREGLTPLRAPEQSAAACDAQTGAGRPRGIADRALAALARYEATTPLDAVRPHTPIADRTHLAKDAAPPDQASITSASASAKSEKADTPQPSGSGPSPGL